jgi:hypothetical protein
MGNCALRAAEACVQNDQIEFRFFGAGGAATGPRGILAFSILVICAMILIGFLAHNTPMFGSAIAWVARILGP